jgi:ribosome biogenesis protein Nip4
MSGIEIYSTPSLQFFIHNNISKEELKRNPEEVIKNFLELDDSHIMVSASQWIKHPDKVIRKLAEGIIYRKLPKVEISKTPFDKKKIEYLVKNICREYKIDQEDAKFLYSNDTISNSAYSLEENKINIIFNDEELKDIATVSDVLNISNINHPSIKFVLCYPKDCV